MGDVLGGGSKPELKMISRNVARSAGNHYLSICGIIELSEKEDADEHPTQKFTGFNAKKYLKRN